MMFLNRRLRKELLDTRMFLPPELRNSEDAYAVLQKLVSKAASRLRRMEYWTEALSIAIEYWGGKSWNHWIQLSPCQDTPSLLEALADLWQKRPKGKAYGTPFTVGISLFKLIADKQHTLSLFQDSKRTRLSKAVDSLNDKYGADTLYFGGSHTVQKAAPTRIGFTNIPDFF